MQTQSNKLDTTFPICGITPFTSLDWPGHLVATLFVSGCPWNCSYCHNRNLRESEERQTWDYLDGFLEARKGFLEGIVFSGGEPTLYEGVLDAMKLVKSKGLGVALHTGGSYPNRLRDILDAEVVSWIGLDFKATNDLYSKVTGDPQSANNFLTSLDLIQKRAVEFEVRTTVGKEVASEETMISMARELEELGVTNWVIQQCRDGGISTGFDRFPELSVLDEWTSKIARLTNVRCKIRA